MKILILLYILIYLYDIQVCHENKSNNDIILLSQINMALSDDIENDSNC